MRVGVIDYGVGNLGSVCRALEELKVTAVLVDRAVDLHGADCLVLPGVGNFSECMQRIVSGGWAAALQEEVVGFNRPLLGICLGMQLLADFGTEGAAGTGRTQTPGLGFIPGRVEHLRDLGCDRRVPHVGWNSLHSRASPAGLCEGIADGTDFYFVHSYAMVVDDPADLVATTEHGIEITAAIHRGNVWGTQFHPEKSSRAGFRLLRNFLMGRQC